MSFIAKAMARGLVITAALIAISSCSQSAFAATVKIDENCNGTEDRTGRVRAIQCDAGIVDPISGVKTIRYILPFGGTDGDLFIAEPGQICNPGNNQLTGCSDLLRWTNGGIDLFVFSDFEAGEKVLDPADNGIQPERNDGNPVDTITEVGPENNNGVTWTPANGDPGFPDFDVDFVFKSDVPEPSMFIPMILAGSGLLLRRRR